MFMSCIIFKWVNFTPCTDARVPIIMGMLKFQTTGIHINYINIRAHACIGGDTFQYDI